MTGELSGDVKEYLRRCGVPWRKIARSNGATRLYHDLGIYGDEAEACLEFLAEEYKVDLTGFEFHKYFPPEFLGTNLATRMFYSLVPGAELMARRRTSYLPLTLYMIDHAIQTKRFALSP